MMKSRVDNAQTNSQWTANDKLRLYNAMAALQEKDCTLYKSKQKIEQKEKLSKIRELRTQIKISRDILNSTKKEDMQRLRKTLQKHNMNILNQEHTFETVLGKIECKIFTETNELNRLTLEEENLSKIYETKLLDLSKFQDRIVHVDQHQLYDEIEANKLRLDIKNCETRISSVKTINNLCQKIIETLLQDFRLFDSALNALTKDIKEQNALLDAIMKLEIPANEDHQELFAECKTLKKTTEKDMKIRLATLNELTSHIVTNNEAIKRLIISDDDVKVKPKPSQKVGFPVEDISTTLESENETDSKHGEIDKEMIEDSEEKITRELNIINQIFVWCTKFDLIFKTEDVMEKLKFDLELETTNQQQIENDLNFAEKIFIKIQSSFKHFVEVLRQIGEDFEDQVNLESAASETEILVRIVLHRCKVVMAIFNEKTMKNNVPSIKMILNTADIEDFADNDKLPKDNKDTDIMDDPSVPTRDRIKALSAKLVELNLKEE